jgi:hypothetical protein
LPGIEDEDNKLDSNNRINFDSCGYIVLIRAMGWRVEKPLLLPGQLDNAFIPNNNGFCNKRDNQMVSEGGSKNTKVII